MFACRKQQVFAELISDELHADRCGAVAAGAATGAGATAGAGTSVWRGIDVGFALRVTLLLGTDIQRPALPRAIRTGGDR